MRKALSVLGPALVFGAIGTALLFSLLDPVDLGLVGPLELGRKAGYAIAFAFFAALAGASSWLGGRLLLRRRSPDAR